MAAPERDGSKAELYRETVTRPRVTTYPRLGVTRQCPGRGHEAACRGEFTSPITSTASATPYCTVGQGARKMNGLKN